MWDIWDGTSNLYCSPKPNLETLCPYIVQNAIYLGWDENLYCSHASTSLSWGMSFLWRDQPMRSPSTRIIGLLWRICFHQCLLFQFFSRILVAGMSCTLEGARGGGQRPTIIFRNIFFGFFGAWLNIFSNFTFCSEKMMERWYGFFSCRTLYFEPRLVFTTESRSPSIFLAVIRVENWFGIIGAPGF